MMRLADNTNTQRRQTYGDSHLLYQNIEDKFYKRLQNKDKNNSKLKIIHPKYHRVF